MAKGTSVTLLPWIAFAGLGAGAMLIGWNVNALGISPRLQEAVAFPLLIVGAIGFSIGLAGALAKLLMSMW